MAPHSSTLAWKIPWTEEPGRLQSMGSLRIRHDWATSLSLFTFMHRRRKWQPLQYSCLENPRDGGAWWAAVYGIAQSWTWLKRLSSSSSQRHSEGSNKSCVHQDPRTPQRLRQNCVWASSVEVRVSSGLPQGQGLWVQQTWGWHKPSWRRSLLTPPYSCQNLQWTGK